MDVLILQIYDTFSRICANISASFCILTQQKRPYKCKTALVAMCCALDGVLSSDVFATEIYIYIAGELGDAGAYNCSSLNGLYVNIGLNILFHCFNEFSGFNKFSGFS